MVKRLDSETRYVYNRIIEDQLSRDFIERVHDDDETRGHYLPHHSVKKDSKTTPIRIVYDCSCRQSSVDPSINDCIETGPRLLNDLAAILLHQRTGHVALSSDIEKAFLMVKLDTRDRDYTKFFWLCDPSDPDSDFIVYRFKSVLFGAACSPFILNAVVKSHLEQYDSPVASDLKAKIYVDNVITSVENESEALDYYRESVKIMSDGGFNLCEWTSNSTALRELAENNNTLNRNEEVNLGMIWNITDDTLKYKQGQKPANIATKREVVKSVSNLYDPLGYLSPVHVSSKIFIQQLWLNDLKWDELLNDELEIQWRVLETDLHRVRREIEIDRQFFPGCVGNCSEPYEINCFSDASMKANGAVVYLHHGKSSIVMAKSRVAPLSQLTLPRLELMGALVGARLCKFVINSLGNTYKITDAILWSDSEIVLSWLKSDKKLQCFVANRVSEILSLPVSKFKYCPTQDNPADLLTRGTTTDKLKTSDIWWRGPSWLVNGDWPISRLNAAPDEICAEVLVQPEILRAQKHGVGSVIDIEKHSSLTRLLRKTALVRRYVNNLRIDKQSRLTEEISASEINTAEILWVKSIQSECFHIEMDQLINNNKRHEPLVKQLRLFIDESGIIRCGGRLHNALLPDSTKFPVLLPKNHWFTRLVVQFYHRRAKHCGTPVTVTQIRQVYWILNIRRNVYCILRKCTTCKFAQGRAYQSPVAPPLREIRVRDAPPFTVTGIDFTGELLVRNRHSNNESKCYIVLFTCASTRAVHLDIVTDMGTATFLRAFRRFVSRRSTPKQVVSDNQSTFECAAKEIRQLFNSPDVQRYFAGNRIQWDFTPKRAPWYGGFWERLVGITKMCLRKVLRRAFITEDELRTAVVEIEASLNDRPITYVYSTENPLDPTPLTPAHLLHGRMITTLPTWTSVDLDDPTYLSAVSEHQKRAKYLSSLLERFRKRWSDEYLVQLRERHTGTGKLSNQIKVGEIVLVHEDNVKRVKWKMALVERLLRGKDGLIRAADIKTANGRTNRPITKLYPLEVNHQPDDQPETDFDPVTDQNKDTLPKRRSAVAARENLKRWTADILN
ncbi:uncharacterized protein LOC141906245 [Tubulanus polymorphus]|uniref:uncharacterized protein LOC141906245 n=1 Tax=Tubulanus polymorphus TaxID=672921 RepID=UPI003DA58E0E